MRGLLTGMTCLCAATLVTVASVGQTPDRTATVLPTQIAVSANDGKHAAADDPKEAPTVDSISVLDLAGPVKVLAELAAPASLIGPPAAVAVARDSSLAVVTAAERLDTDGKLVPADIVSVIDLQTPKMPLLAQTLHAGKGASGVAIDPSGSIALVANATEDSISVFSISQRRLYAVGTVSLPAKSKPLDIAFSDLRTAYVVEQGADAIARLKVDGQDVSVAQSIAVGSKPYSMAIAKRVAYVTNLGGAAQSTQAHTVVGTVAVVDLRAGKMLNQIDVGMTPEHVALSPSGRYLEVTVINGSNAPVVAAEHHDHGIMLIYRAKGRSLVPLTHIETGAWCQGATWTNDERRVLLQCAARKQIEIYGFDGNTLTPNANPALQFDSRPGAIATALSR